MTHLDLTRRGVRLSRPLPANRVLRAWALYRQRRALADLDAARLDDLGISADAARTEAARPVWDAPHHWSR